MKATLVAALLLAACGSEISASPDAAPEGEDAALAGLDASTAGLDVHSPIVDAASPGVDAALPGADASLAGPDASHGLGHPFGTHSPYFATGVIYPTAPQSQRDSATAAFYDAWKQAYLKPACKAGQYLVKSTPATDPWTVSEGHGYGMVFAVMMAGHDPQAKAIFDGLAGFYDDHRSDIDSGLMAWAQDKTCKNTQGADAATDGDLDIAFAFLLADRQWGSAGSIDYLRKAKTIIASILASEVHPKNSLLVGDWSGSSDSHYDGTRPSDFAINHFKAFARATGVARWTDVADKTYSIIGYLQDHSSPATGLLPDFVVGAPGATPSPAPGNWLEGADDGHYSWNACRTPWRIATDYLISGDARSQAAVRRMNAWIRTKTNGDPKKIAGGYDLSGNVLDSSNELAFVAPFGVSAMVEAQGGSNQAWLDAVWSHVAAQPVGDYFADSLKLMTMLVMSGNWWAP